MVLSEECQFIKTEHWQIMYLIEYQVIELEDDEVRNLKRIK